MLEASMSRPASDMERVAAYLEAWRPYFHPVATTAELDAPRLDEFGRQQPLGVELLGQRLVVARIGDGVAALAGTCPHRSAGLHVGWVADDGCAVVCRYHGAEWSSDGSLRTLPAMAVEGHQTPRWRIASFPAQERYGLIWVCLEQQPRFPLLEFPEAEDPAFVHIPVYAETWTAGVGRMIEASLDTYHFAFTHRGTLGDPDNPQAPRPDVELRDGSLWISYAIDQVTNAGIASVDGDSVATTRVAYHMRARPNAVRLTKVSAVGEFIIYIAVAPLGPRRSRWYRLVVRNHDLDVPARVYTDLENAINRQDQIVIESMEPWQSTSEVDEELHVVMDRPTLAYRRWMRELGARYL
jgi:vanillate O-demethylase monooxygenase subunit